MPVFQHLYVYLLPGLQLLAGVALLFLKKEAFPLYAAYFAGLLAMPLMTSTIFLDPYPATGWVEVYKDRATGVLGFGWLIALAIASYAAYLYRRGILK